MRKQSSSNSQVPFEACGSDLSHLTNDWLSSRLVVSQSAPALTCNPALLEHIRQELTSSVEWFERISLGFPFCFPSRLTQRSRAYSELVRSLDAGAQQARSLQASKRCAVVGNSGLLSGSSLGPAIDRYDVVIRMNDSPAGGTRFEPDVGGKTTFRIVYAESLRSTQLAQRPDEHLLFAAFKQADLSFLATRFLRLPPHGDLHSNLPALRIDGNQSSPYWAEVLAVPIQKPKRLVSLLGPQVFLWASQLIWQAGWTDRRRHQGRQPTTGVVAAVFALHFCSEQVDLFGFSSGSGDPREQLHYYEMGRPRSGVLRWQAHDLQAERRLLRWLAVSRAVGWFPSLPQQAYRAGRELVGRVRLSNTNESAKRKSCPP